VHLACDIHAGWQAIATATVDDGMQAKNWDYWLEFCSKARQDPYLLGYTKPVQQQLLIGFAARVRRGYDHRLKVQAQTPMKPHSATWHKPLCWLDTETPGGPMDPKT
jgi:hypothetical protein